MNVEQAFWEMITEIGGSPKELNQLNVDVSFFSRASDNGNPVIHLWLTKLDASCNRQIEVVEDPKTSDFSVQVLFHSHYVDLHDPESFKKLKSFLEFARKQNSIKDRHNADI